MPGDLFAHTLAKPRPTKSRWTIAGSLVAHLALIVALVVVPVVSTVDGPDIVSRLEAFVVAMPPPPTPPAPSRPAPPPDVKTPTTNPNMPPVAPPEGIRPETTITSAAPGVPGAESFATSSRGDAQFLATSTMRLDPPPSPRPRDPVRPGGAIQEPRRIAYVPPIYPDIARQARIEGTVIVEAVIDETGAVRDVKVLRSIAMLDRAAVEAVSKWRYTATRLNGVAVPILMTVSVTFSLR